MEKNITVYTTTQCPYCIMLKNFLSQNNISFREINVEKDQTMMQKLVSQTGQYGVPQTEVAGKWIVGFDPERIMAALEDK